VLNCAGGCACEAIVAFLVSVSHKLDFEEVIFRCQVWTTFTTELASIFDTILDINIVTLLALLVRL